MSLIIVKMGVHGLKDAQLNSLLHGILELAGKLRKQLPKDTLAKNHIIVLDGDKIFSTGRVGIKDGTLSFF
jgi:hypothetical protein